MNQQAQTITTPQFETLIASIQKQMSDSDITQFLSTIDTLGREYTTDKTVVSLLKMMQSIGKYVERKKNRAHPECFTVLSHLVKGFIEVTQSGFSAIDKNQILQNNHRVFDQLRHKISTSSPEQTRIYELKATLLSLEWEINPETLLVFKQKVGELKQIWNQNKLYCSFLNILNVLVKYIDHQKANAYKGTVVLIRMVYDHLEFIVFNPGLPFERKKRMLNQDIEKLNAFKRTIIQPSGVPQKKAELTELPPALSQYKPSHVSDQKISAEFYPLSDDQAFACDHQIDNLLEWSESSAETPYTDVMDDLFNPKASPVDDLLDKIHLMNVLGENKSTAKKSQENDAETSHPGVQKVISRRINKKPGQEINHRIEEFFNREPAAPAPGTLEPQLVSPQDFLSELPSHELRLLIDQAIESMHPDDIETIILEISKQNKNFSQDPENEQLNHVLLSCGKLIEKMSDQLFQKAGPNSWKISSLLSGLKRVFNS